MYLSRRATQLLRQLNQEVNHVSIERDTLIQAVRDALGGREHEWFPDGFPASDAAAEAILWLGEQLHDLGGVPSRWDD